MVLWALPLLLVKEDLGLTVAAIGVVLWQVGERRRGALLALGAVAAMALVLLVIVPGFSAGGSYAYTSNIGGQRGRTERQGGKAGIILPSALGELGTVNQSLKVQLDQSGAAGLTSVARSETRPSPTSVIETA